MSSRITAVFGVLLLMAGAALACPAIVVDSQCGDLHNCNLTCPLDGTVSIVQTVTYAWVCPEEGEDPGEMCSQSVLKCGVALTWEFPGCFGNVITSDAKHCLCGTA